MNWRWFSILGIVSTMKAFTSLVVMVGALIDTSCSKQEQSAIVGRWHEAGGTVLAVFHEDGTIELSDGKDELLIGRYSFVARGKLKLEFTGKTAARSHPDWGVNYELSGEDAVLGSGVYQVAYSAQKISLTGVHGRKSNYVKLR